VSRAEVTRGVAGGGVGGGGGCGGGANDEGTPPVESKWQKISI